MEKIDSLSESIGIEELESLWVSMMVNSRIQRISTSEDIEFSFQHYKLIEGNLSFEVSILNLLELFEEENHNIVSELRKLFLPKLKIQFLLSKKFNLNTLETLDCKNISLDQKLMLWLLTSPQLKIVLFIFYF